MVRFDFDETFGDDYLHFYLPSLSEETNDAEADQIVSLLSLEPGATVLDVPCGHGRIANRLAQRGCHVTGLDRTPQFLDVARQDAEAIGVDVDYLEGDMRDLPWSAQFEAVVCWFTSFGYFDDDDNREVLRQFRKVLRPGGALLIETLHHDSLARGTFTGREGEPLTLDTWRLVVVAR